MEIFIMQITCKYCGNVFEKPESFIAQQRKIYGDNGSSFCSRSCACSYRKSLHWEQRICEYCKKPFLFKSSNSHASGREDRGKYCSKKCYTAIGRATNKCIRCGKEFETLKFFKNKRKYCSNECARNIKVDKLPITCVMCGKVFYDVLSKVDKRKCCSKECFCKYISQHLRQNADDNRRRCSRSGWKIIRQAAIERDGGKCVRCGSVEQITVHHIIPWRKTQNDSLENLITLCRSCHIIVEPRYRKNHIYKFK